jgi:hypothetical protein
MKEAKNLIYSALNIAISKGCFNLDESIQIVDALRLVLVEEEEEDEHIQ